MTDKIILDKKLTTDPHKKLIWIIIITIEKKAIVNREM